MSKIQSLLGNIQRLLSKDFNYFCLILKLQPYLNSSWRDKSLDENVEYTMIDVERILNDIDDGIENINFITSILDDFFQNIVQNGDCGSIFTKFEIGKEFFEEGRYSDSLKIFDHVMENISDLHAFRDILYLRGISRLGKQTFQNFLLAYEDFDLHIKEICPNDGRAYRYRGILSRILNLGDKGETDFNQAIEFLTIQIKNNPFESDLFRIRGLVYQDIGQNENAITDFNECIRLGKNKWQGYNNRGILFMKFENYLQALDDLSKSISLNPRRACSYGDRGNLFIAIKLNGNAIYDFSKAIEIDPGYAIAYYNRGNCFEHFGLYDLAEADFAAGNRLDSSRIRARTFSKEERLERKSKMNPLIDRPSKCEPCGKIGSLRCKICNWKTYCSDKCMEEDKKSHVLECLLLFGRLDWLASQGMNVNVEKVDRDKIRQMSIRKDHLLAAASFYQGDFETALVELTKHIDSFPFRLCSNHSYAFLLSMRARSLHELKRYEEEILDLNFLVEDDPEDTFSLHGRYWAFMHLRDFEKARRDLRKIIEKGSVITNRFAGKSNQKLVTDTAQIMGIHGFFQESHDFFKTAIEMDPDEPNVYRRRMEVSKNSDIERYLDDALRVTMMTEKTGDSTSTRFDHVLQREKKEALSKLKFRKDNEADVELERKEISQLRRKLENLEVMELIIHRGLGVGVSGRAVLCNIRNVSGVFVLKVFNGTGSLTDEEIGERIKRDSLGIPYSRYCVDVLVALGTSQVRDRVKLFFNKRSEKEEVEGEDDENNQEWEDDENNQEWEDELEMDVNRALLLMRYYPIDLDDYILGKKAAGIAIDPIDICFILKGLLKGSKHLNDNMFIHRDLHTKNVFIDPAYGRVIIGDFGCALDLKDHGFQLKISDLEKLGNSPSYSNDDVRGGALKYLPPEVIDEEELVNYEKCDLYSVGMIGYELVDASLRYFDSNKNVNHGIFAPFGVEKDEFDEFVPVTLGRKQTNYVDFSKYYDVGTLPEVCSKLFLIIGKIIHCDIGKRVDFNDSLEEIEKIIEILEENKVKKDLEEVFVSNMEQIWGKDQTEVFEVDDSQESDSDSEEDVEMLKKAIELSMGIN